MTTKEFISIIDNYIPLGINDPRTDESYLYELTEGLEGNQDAVLAIEPIFKLIEKYPTTDFGSPGPLVHTIERFQGHYEKELLTSLRRKPTQLTVWMLNRIINVTEDATTRTSLIETLNAIAESPTVDSVTRQDAVRFIRFQNS